jgi:hypothetical protein
MWLLAVVNFFIGILCGLRFGVSVLVLLALVPPLEMLIFRLTAEPWFVVLWYGLLLLTAIEIGYVTGTLAVSFRGSFAGWRHAFHSDSHAVADRPDAA